MAISPVVPHPLDPLEIMLPDQAPEAHRSTYLKRAKWGLLGVGFLLGAGTGVASGAAAATGRIIASAALATASTVSLSGSTFSLWKDFRRQSRQQEQNINFPDP